MEVSGSKMAGRGARWAGGWAGPANCVKCFQMDYFSLMALTEKALRCNGLSYTKAGRYTAFNIATVFYLRWLRLDKVNLFSLEFLIVSVFFKYSSYGCLPHCDIL